MQNGSLAVERQRCLRELAALPGWVTGSLVETERTRGRTRTAFRYLSRSVGGRNRITYVSAGQVERFRGGLRAGTRAWQLFVRIAELTVAILKAGDEDRTGGAR